VYTTYVCNTPQHALQQTCNKRNGRGAVSVRADGVQLTPQHTLQHTATRTATHTATGEMAGGLLGPALTVYNDETFSEQDFQNITNTGDSGKRQVRHDSVLCDMTPFYGT